MGKTQGFQGVNRKKVVSAMINKGKRITIYAESGRVSMNKILRIAQQHAGNENYIPGLKAIKEYKVELKRYYNEKLAKAIEIEATLKEIKAENDYKKDLLS